MEFGWVARLDHHQRLISLGVHPADAETDLRTLATQHQSTGSPRIQPTAMRDVLVAEVGDPVEFFESLREFRWNRDALRGNELREILLDVRVTSDLHPRRRATHVDEGDDVVEENSREEEESVDPVLKEEVSAPLCLESFLAVVAPTCGDRGLATLLGADVVDPRALDVFYCEAKVVERLPDLGGGYLNVRVPRLVACVTVGEVGDAVTGCHRGSSTDPGGPHQNGNLGGGRSVAVRPGAGPAQTLGGGGTSFRRKATGRRSSTPMGRRCRHLAELRHASSHVLARIVFRVLARV